MLIHFHRALLALLLLWVPCIPVHAQVSNGLIAKYSFEDNLNDSSGNGYPGTGNALTYAAGKVGRAAQFNGTSTHMKVNALAGVLPSGNQARTIAFWMYLESGQAGFGNMVSWGTSSASTQRYSMGVQNSGVLYFVGENNDVPLNRTVPLDTWVHVVITYENQSFTSYLDGVINNTPVSVGTFNTSSAFGLILGEGPPNLRTGQEYFKGRLDELLLYDRALTATEVATISVDASLAPAVTSLSPSVGPTAGGTSVTITGTDFTGATAVRFGTNAATSVTVVSATEITAVSPAGSAGTVHVTVTTPSGVSVAVNGDQFTYQPPVNGSCGAAGGGTTSFVPAANLCTVGSAGSVARQGSDWSWSCNGSSGGTNSSCLAPVGLTGANTGAVSAIAAATNGWVVNTAASAGFIPLTGHASSPSVPPPAGVSFPHGLFDVDLITGTAGTAATLTITYPQPLPAGAVYYKFGPTQSNATPHWFVYPHATISGNTVTLTLTDGQDGDTDLLSNSHIHDPGGPALLALAGGATGIPTLSQWMLLCLSLLLAAVAPVALRQYRR